MGVRSQALNAVVGASGEDGGGAIKLLGQHDPREHVRPDHFAKGQGCVSFGPEGRVDPVCPADDKGNITSPAIPPAGKLVCEFRRRHHGATFVHRADHGALWDRFAQQRGLARHAAGFAIFDFCYGQRTEAQTPPASIKAGLVVVDQRAFGARPQAAHRADMNPHLRFGRVGGIHPHLFDLIEVADFRTEKMHDHVACIDQNPVTGGFALDA